MTQNASLLSSEKPLLGAVVCCTSITPEDRTRIAEYAEQMGAEHKLDLTSDVTHLLVGSTDTPKYQYVAREREDVKVLQPEWVEAVRECWMEDRSLDMNALEAKYRVPTLAGLKICITGFDDLAFRAELQKNVIANGGEYTGDLTKDVTHLIATKAEGKKYQYATQWQKKIVSIQWYKDTLDRGMQLDETSYHPSRPLQEQGIGAWNRQEKKAPKTGKRTKDDQSAQEPLRKFRRVASAKLGSQTEDMWGDIVGHASRQTGAQREHLRSAKSMPVIRGDAQADSDIQTIQENLGPNQAEGPKTADGLLSGLCFAVSNFEKRKEELIQRTLRGTGAIVLDSLDALLAHRGTAPDSAYLIVPHQTQQNELSSSDKSLIIVTELWLERCMVQKGFIPPNRYPLGGVITKITVPGIANFALNATGFQSIETLHIAKTTTLTGARYEEVFSPKSTVLVCNSRNLNQQKLFHAKQWNIPAVSEAWLCEFLTQGQIPDFESFLIGREDEGSDLEAEMNRRRREQRKPRTATSHRDELTATHTSRTGALANNAAAPRVDDDKAKPPSQEDHGRQTAGGSDVHPSKDTRGRSSTEEPVLREISPNSPTRKAPAAQQSTKKSLFKNYDGAEGQQENSRMEPPRKSSGNASGNPSPRKSGQDAVTMNSAIQDLLNMKSRAKMHGADQAAEQGSKRRRLLGRALSNLSNVSHGSRQSRASSVDSLNTDGVGSEIAPPSGKADTGDDEHVVTRAAPLQGRARNKTSAVAPSDRTHRTASVDISDPHLLRDEIAAEDEGPQLTQLGYEDSAESIALQEKLAEKKRARARTGQKEGQPENGVRSKEKEAPKQPRRVIQDDETMSASGWGGGRRTRQKNKSIEMTGLEMF